MLMASDLLDFFVSWLTTMTIITRGEGDAGMNTDQVKGKMKQLTGEIKRKWGQLTDDDLREAQGSMEKLIGKIQERTGDRREEIEKWLKQQGLEN
jgi:uncharacterized protein YjbJ (UPF0337 family)